MADHDRTLAQDGVVSPAEGKLSDAERKVKDAFGRGERKLDE